MDIRDLFEFVRKTSLFSVLEDEEIAEIMQAAELKSVRAGELVFDQGDAGDSFYIVYSGRIRILQKNELNKEINLGVVTRGDHFGESALITEKSRNAAARAVEDSILISIERHSFDNYFFSKPELREYFDRFIRYTSVNNFLKTCTNLAAVSPKDLQELSRQIDSEFYRQGDVVFRQGAEPDKFYLIESGKVKIVVWDENKQEVINFLREGDFFGEKALVEDTKRSADAICLTDCHLFSLSKDDFNKLVIKSPRIKNVIEDRINSYLVQKPPIPYKEIIKQELSALKEIDVKKDIPKDDITYSKKKKKYLKSFSSFYRRQISFPFIRQYDEMTCGTTCIMMIAKYYGKHFSSSRLRELAHVDLSGASMANLASAAEQLGFSARGMKIDYNKLMSVHHPCVVHWQGYHYIVVYKVNEKNVWVADPAVGLRRYDKEYFANNWSGITLVLEPSPEFERQSEDKSSFKNFIQFVLPHRLILFEIFVASILLSVFGLATPIFIQNLIDDVLSHNNISMLNIMLVGMIIVIIFRLLVSILRQYLIVHTSLKIDLRMLVCFYKHMLALPLGYFKVRKIGDFIARFGENRKIRDFLTKTALTFVFDAMLIIVYLTLMIYYNVQMAGLALLFVSIFTTLALMFAPVLKRLNIDSSNAKAVVESHMIESINGIDTVKTMNIEYWRRWKWEDVFIKSLNIDYKLCNTATCFHALGDFVGTLSSTVVLWYGALKVMQGVLSVGELMAFMALMGSVITPIDRIILGWDDIQQTLVSADRLNDMFSAKSELPESMEEATSLVIKEPVGEIVFEKVFFRYGGDDDPYILSDINLKITPGQSVAIVGRSGAGKTTLVRLIARLYDAAEGKITIDRCDIKNINLANLRKVVGLVHQEDFIFNWSIRENISLGDPEETIDKVIEAAKLADAHDFISDLPLRYETKVGESGLQLSAGQKQRISIARVIYKKPKIIILDEATSLLDIESEQAIQKNMEAFLRDRTAITVAQRLSTARDADNIIVLDNGEIVEQGTHEQLMDMQGLYHYLNHRQLRS